MLVPSGPARADVAALAKCQKVFAREGAKFAVRVIRSNLKCADEVSQCQIECEVGEFGTCDPDDTSTPPGYVACLAKAQTVCDAEALKRASYEASKQERIIASCIALTQDELCGAQAEGLSFATLNAGCSVLNPGYTCTLDNLVACVGGPLERQLLDQIS